MKLMKNLAISLGVLSLVAGAASVANAGSANGVWLRAATGAHIQAYDCKGGLGLKIVKSKTKEFEGKEIACGNKLVSENKWKGELLNVEDGKTYTGHMTLIDADTLKIEGCVLGGIICKGDEWKRVK